MKHITVGVAGHIDHGKTALVRALTGTETDRLKEERERGMSIVLGFAHLALPGGEVDLIDVPGHEKFVRTMIAGATGIDAALLTVAANERVKPQTVEHVALMGLLGVRQGLVVVSKSDLVPDEDERALVADELRAFLQETFLRDAPLIFASAVTGEGLVEITARLQDLLAEAAPPREQPYFTLPIDRAFTMVGQGTIVTGTLRRGPVRVGQTVEIGPRGLKAEVRGLEVHGQPVLVAPPGWRTAVNLRGVKKDDVAHGDTLATVGALRPTRLLDAELTLLASADKPVKRGQGVVLHYGTSEAAARVYPLGQPEVRAGETAFVQFRLSQDAVVPAGEPFVIRMPSPVETVGGGRIIDPYPPKHTHVDEAVLRSVQTLAHGSPGERLREKLRQAGPEGRDARQLTQDLGLRPDALTPDLPAVFCSGGLVLHPDAFEVLRIQAQALVTQFHAAHPTRRGMPQEELRRRLPRALKPAAYHRLIESLTDGGALETFDGLVRAAGYSPEAALSAVEREIAREIEAEFRQGGLKPPDLDAVLKRDRRRKSLYHFLVESGALVPTTERTTNKTVVFHRDALAQAARRLRAALSEGEGQTVSQLNAVLGTTRKFSIPLLEHLDSLGVTRRAGDLRYGTHPAAGGGNPPETGG
jgi:selenocysteine-specific elongation factor